MNPTEPDQPMNLNESFSDERIEELLVEFFQAEMPAEFRDTPVRAVRTTPPATSTVTPVVTRTTRERTAPGVLGLFAAAASLLVLVVLATGPERRAATSPSDPVADLGPAPPAEDETPFDGPAFHLTEDDLFVERVEGHVESFDGERFDTDRGPVELRARRETTSVSVVDPSSGVGVDLETQVLDIEVVPIDLDGPTIDLPLDEHPDDLPMPRNDGPMLPEAGGGH